MNELNLVEVKEFIQENIGPKFHKKKLDKITRITLDDVIKRKNPYLFKAKNSISASDFIKSVLDATVSSGEETTFGNFLEEVAIFVCEKVYDGRKSGIKGLDLEFENGNNKYLLSIKSGPNWGNSGQLRQMVSNFTTARRTLQTSGGHANTNFVCVEACCYGVEATPNRGTHFKLCGQEFWKLISGGSESLYKDIIEPLGHQAQQQNDAIAAVASQKLNTFTQEFVTRFCDDGIINWGRLVEFNSGAR